MMEGNHPDAFNWRSLPGDRLNDVCTDLVIVKLAIEMTCWEPFALPLGLSDAKVTEIQRSNPDYLYQKQKFLIEWKKQHGSKASYYKLFECFEMLDRRDLIEVLIPLCLDQNKESNHTGRRCLVQIAYTHNIFAVGLCDYYINYAINQLQHQS